jgi:hypothetical protein
MSKILFPEKVTKELMFQMYGDNMSRKLINSYINHCIRMLGGNVRTKNLTNTVRLLFIIEWCTPEGYFLSEKDKERLNKISSDNIFSNNYYMRNINPTQKLKFFCRLP